jgi:hypothetical protein
MYSSVGHIVHDLFTYIILYLTIMFTQVCKDKHQAECWYLGLTALISAPCTPLLLVNSTNGCQINSCTNSPPSYVQQRSRLFVVHHGRSFTKVHFGIPTCMIFMHEHDSVPEWNLTLLMNFSISHQVACSNSRKKGHIDGECHIRSCWQLRL